MEEVQRICCATLFSPVSRLEAVQAMSTCRVASCFDCLFVDASLPTSKFWLPAGLMMAGGWV
jgi:hypothetical protein